MHKIVIFGACSAIAQAAARQWAASSAEFVLVGRDLERLNCVRQDLEVRGARRVECLKSDLADLDGHARLLGEIGEICPDFDIALIAYGVLPDQQQCQMEFVEARAAFNINFLSVVSLLTSLANRFEALQRGSIVVITSVAGDRGRQSNYVYGAAKGGLSVFLSGLRNRLQRSNIQVLDVRPGFVATPMTAEMKQGPLFVSPEVVGKGIYKAVQNKKDVAYLPWFWLWIMLIIRAIPEKIFKRLKL
ncbi:MAG: SDR family oxidoreductase [Bdellovibrionales bacterium]|nr:SDR family oxidoreductase [Bdellovibrionales bacterium]